MEKATVLLVDDTPDNLTLLTSLLKESYKVKIAISGKKVLQIAQSASPPDIILLDIMMPEMDGFEVCRLLKADPATARIPVVFLSGEAEASDRERGLSLGAVGYLTKPIDPPAVLALVEKIVGI
jgi:putative two-component system response regulator